MFGRETSAELDFDQVDSQLSLKPANLAGFFIAEIEIKSSGKHGFPELFILLS